MGRSIERTGACWRMLLATVLMLGAGVAAPQPLRADPTIDGLQADVAARPLDPWTWHALAKALQKRGDLEGAREAFRSVLELAQEQINRELIAVAATNLAEIGMVKGDLDQAESMYYTVLDIADQLDQPLFRATTYANLGLLQTRRGDLDGAEAFYLKSQQVYKSLGDWSGMAATSVRIGIIWSERDDKDRACARFREAAQFYDTAGDTVSGNHVRGWVLEAECR